MHSSQQNHVKTKRSMLSASWLATLAGASLLLGLSACGGGGDLIIGNLNTPTPMGTLSPTASNTPTPTGTLSPTASNTPTPTNTLNPTASNTPTPTNTLSPTASNTPTPTNTLSPTASNTPTPTNTLTPTATDTPTPTPTNTHIPGPTDSPTPTNTQTPTPSNTPTSTPTSTPTPLPFSVLHHFDTAKTPYAGLVWDSTGSKLHGTSVNGGAANSGTLFEIDASTGGLTVRQSFNSSPYGGLVRGNTPSTSHIFYGTAVSGGTYTLGFVYQFNASTGVTNVLHHFAGINENDGAKPYATLVINSTGTALYGSTWEGGAYGQGSVFKVDLTTGQTSTLHSFNGSDGNGAYAPLVLNSTDSTLYGTTVNGGVHSSGTIFKIELGTGALTTLYNFPNNIPNNGYPYGGLVFDGASNTLYGVTGSENGLDMGSVFKFDLSANAFSTLHTFNGNDGKSPMAGLVLDSSNSVLYGTTHAGGFYDKGTVFKLDTASNTLTTLHSFHTSEGYSPFGVLLLDSSQQHLYGTTRYGGNQSNGTVFKLPLF